VNEFNYLETLKYLKSTVESAQPTVDFFGSDEFKFELNEFILWIEGEIDEFNCISKNIH